LFPDGSTTTNVHLIEIRDQIAKIIGAGTVQERETMCEALLAEPRTDDGIATPVIRIPISGNDTSLIPQKYVNRPECGSRTATIGGAEGT